MKGKSPNQNERKNHEPTNSVKKRQIHHPRSDLRLASARRRTGGCCLINAGEGRPSQTRRKSCLCVRKRAVIPHASSASFGNDNRVGMTLQTSGLAPGNAVTAWWVVFNNPDFWHARPVWSSLCGVNHLPPNGGDPRVQASLLHATGHVVGGAGFGHFGGYLSEGNLSGAKFGSRPARRGQCRRLHLVVPHTALRSRASSESRLIRSTAVSASQGNRTSASA